MHDPRMCGPFRQEFARARAGHGNVVWPAGADVEAYPCTEAESPIRCWAAPARKLGFARCCGLASGSAPARDVGGPCAGSLRQRVRLRRSGMGASRRFPSPCLIAILRAPPPARTLPCVRISRPRNCRLRVLSSGMPASATSDCKFHMRQRRQHSLPPNPFSV